MQVGIGAVRHARWPKVDWLETALGRIGCQVRRATRSCDLGELFETCNAVILGHKSLSGRWPDLAPVFSRRGRAPACYVWFDLIACATGVPLEQQSWFRQYAPLLRASELVLVKERGLLAEYRSLGVAAEWWDQGCPSDYPAVTWRTPAWDLLVWGQAGHYRQRVTDVRAAVRRGFRVAWAGDGPLPDGVEQLPWTDPWKLPELAGQARCVLSCGLRNDLEGYWSDGFWLACGMGACVLRRATPGLPEGPYAVYRDAEELVQWLDHYRDETAARETGEQTRAWVMAHHALEHRAADLRERLARIAGMAGN
jgi:hypothetical protein